MIALLCRRIFLTFSSSCRRRGRCNTAVHLSHSSMEAVSPFAELARAMQSSQGTLAAGRRPRGFPIFELLDIEAQMCRNKGEQRR